MRPHIGTGVVRQPVPESQEAALPVERDRELVDLLPRVIRRVQVLAAVLRPGDGPAEPPGAERDQEVLGVDLAARAEAPSDVQLDQAQALERETEHAGEDAPVHMDDLRRAHSIRSSTTRCAEAKSASMLPCSIVNAAARLLPGSSCRIGAPSTSAASPASTGSSGS